MFTQNHVLTSAQKRLFRKQGFLVLRNFVTAEALDQARGHLESLFARFHELPRDLARDLAEPGPGSATNEPINPEITRCRELAPLLARTTLADGLERVAGELLGPMTRLFFDHAIRKPARFGGATDWHQDAAYDKGFEKWHRLSCWIPFQRVDADSGAMALLPGTHRGNGPLPHRHVCGQRGGHTLTLDPPPGIEPVLCPVEQGDVIVHHPLAIHRAGENRGQTPRLVWVLIFSAPRLSAWGRLRAAMARRAA